MCGLDVLAAPTLTNKSTFMSAILLLAFISLVTAGYDDLRYFRLIVESEKRPE